MALKQPNTNAPWTEPQGSGTAIPIVSAQFVADGIGGYKIKDSASTDVVAARMFADAFGGFTVTPGASNPSALAELRIVDLGVSGFFTYQ